MRMSSQVSRLFQKEPNRLSGLAALWCNAARAADCNETATGAVSLNIKS